MTMFNVQELARQIIGGANRWGQIQGERYQHDQDLYVKNPTAFNELSKYRTQELMNDYAPNLMGIGSMSGVGKLTNLVTDIPRQNLLSYKTPYILAGRPKVYESIRQAIKAAKMAPKEEGQRLFPQNMETVLDVLKKRLASLEKHGGNTASVKKAIQEELKLYTK